MSKLNRVQIVTTAALVLGALSLSSRHAEASPKGYRDAMKTFAPVIADWAAELQVTSSAALAKPELACGAQMSELARRGASIAADLEGMDAPAALDAAQEGLTRSVRQMTDAADAACGNPGAAALRVQTVRPGFDASLLRIRNFATGAFTGGGR